jgi:hypothetical protein
MRKLQLVALCLSVFVSSAFTQEQNPPPPTVRDYCVKVAPGKSTEFETFVRDVSVPLNRSRADAGEFDWFLVARGVVPAGSTAKCDYRVVYGFKGLPPETLSNDQLDAALKRAKLNMTAKEMVARRDALSQLVDVEIWYGIDSTGSPLGKGSYVRLNHYSIKPGAMDDWRRLETSYWKPLVDAWIKSGAKGSWGLNGLLMPQGDNLPYNALTYDGFADWNSLIQGVPFSTWSKVHPHTEATDVFDRLERVRSIHDVEVYKVIEAVGATKTTSN